jgi:hypothetical protein
MKIDLTASDLQKLAVNSLTKKAAAEAYLKKNKSKLIAAIKEAADEVIADWIFEHEIDEPQVTDDEDNDWEED